jgi:hypothetical protein
VDILNELEDQLGELARVTQPIYTRTRALTWARENIKKVQQRADEVLEHIDVSRKVRPGYVDRGLCLWREMKAMRRKGYESLRNGLSNDITFDAHSVR